MPTLSHLSSDNVIKIPTHEASEFEVQAFVYSSLLAKGVRIRGEVVTAYASNGCRRERCRFDLVIFDERQNATRIIEVKARKNRNNLLCENGRQPHRYRHFGVPVTFIRGMGEAIKFVEAFDSLTTE